MILRDRLIGLARTATATTLTLLLLGAVASLAAAAYPESDSPDSRDQGAPVGAAARDLLDETAGRLISEGECGVIQSVLQEPPVDLEREIREAGGSGRWLTGRRAYVGTLSEAITAFGGELVGADKGVAWMIIEVGQGERVGQELRRLTTATGAEVWLAANLLKSQVCPPESQL